MAALHCPRIHRASGPAGWVLLAHLICTPVPGQQDEDKPLDPVNLTFGVYTSDKPTAMYRMFTPFIEATENTMQSRLGCEVNIQLRIFKNYESGLNALVLGDVDFVRFGPASYVLAKKRNPKLALLAMEIKDGKKSFKGFVVVRKKSPFKTLADLKGKRFAFGDKNSTIGRYLVQNELLNAGIRAKDLAKFEFLGRHDKVFRAVELGYFEAGALKSGTFDKLNKKGTLRVLASFDNVSKPWVGSSKLSADIRAALTFALRSIDDKDALKALKCDRLVAAEDKEYRSIRQSMVRSVKFDEAKPKPAARPK